MLSARFEERSRELEDARIEILDRLARACEMREQGTLGHGQRVAALAAEIAVALGWSAESVDHLRKAAALHDIGKIGVDDSILLKPGPLAESEFEAQTRHTILGAAILSGSRFPVLRMAEEVALTHHERWDGCGYPAAIAGDDIPLSGRIVAVADVFDALTHQRPYKKAWTPEEAVAQIRADAGSRYDPVVVAAFLRVAEQGRTSPVVKTEQKAGTGKGTGRSGPRAVSDPPRPVLRRRTA
jgi:putative two-component system response regulator